MNERRSIMFCRHSIYREREKWHTFLILYRPCMCLNRKKVMNFISPCIKCGLLLAPSIWLLTAIGAFDAVVYIVACCFISVAAIFNLFGANIVVNILLSACVYTIICVPIRSAIDALFLLVHTWKPIPKQLQNERENAMYNAYLRGQKGALKAIAAILLLCYVLQ